MHNAGVTERGQEAPWGENDGKPHVNGESSRIDLDHWQRVWNLMIYLYMQS